MFGSEASPNLFTINSYLFTNKKPPENRKIKQITTTPQKKIIKSPFRLPEKVAGF